MSPRLRLGLGGLVLTAAFLGLGLLVAHQPLGLDVAVANALRGQDSRPLGEVAGVLTNVLGPVLPVILGVVLLGLAALRREVLWLKLTVVLVLARLTSFAGKPLFLRQRPRAYPDLSYPSGHVVSVASTGLVLVLLCACVAPRLVRRVLAIAVAATVLAAACRIVLGVHWVTDTLGAVLAVTGVGLLTTAALGVPPPGGRSLDA